VVCFGDFLQLPPIDDDPCFISSYWDKLCLRKNTFVLTKVVRQKDEEFINVLNEIRFGDISEKSVEYLQELDINKKVVNANKDYPMFKIEPKPIYLHINSYGGCIFSAFTAIDFITNSSIPIYTIIEGASASAATLISVCGKKRYMCKNASMLIHQLSSGMIGKMSTLDDQYINLNEMMKKIKDIYLTNTTIKKNRN